MRTTVTLDDDVAAKLRAEAHERGISFKEALNSSVRKGLRSAGAKPVPYRIPTRDLGVRAGVNLDKALALAAELEDSETQRKLALRK